MVYQAAGGAGSLLSQGSNISGSLGWVFMASLMGCNSNMSTFIGREL